MLEKQEDVFYYLTLVNENYQHPAIPAGAREGILRGMYQVRESGLSNTASGLRVQLLGSGSILGEALAAAELLEQDWGIGADVWSVTSFTQLRRDGIDIERWNRLHPLEMQRLSWVEQCLHATEGPVIAVSDYVRAVPDLIRTWVPRPFVALGTDGFGRSDTRAALRKFFEIDRKSIAVAAVSALAKQERVPSQVVADVLARYGSATSDPNPWDR
jgi:pyruvate dehydrogenase E1 component